MKKTRLLIIKQLNQARLLLAYFLCFISDDRLLLPSQRVRELMTQAYKLFQPIDSFIKLGMNIVPPLSFPVINNINAEVRNASFVAGSRKF